MAILKNIIGVVLLLFAIFFGVFLGRLLWLLFTGVGFDIFTLSVMAILFIATFAGGYFLVIHPILKRKKCIEK